MTYIKDLFPFSSALGPEKMALNMAVLESEVFQHPFFDQGVSALREKLKLTLHEFDEDNWSALSLEEEPLPLVGFIFHMSHSGSTLLAQMLASLPSNRVISEAECLNSILLRHSFSGLDDELTIQRLRSLLRLFCRKAFGQERVYVKFSSWNAILLQLIRKSFPEVPWIFLERHPLEVLVGLEKSQNGFVSWYHSLVKLLPAAYLQLPLEEVNKLSMEEYMAAMLKRKIEEAEKNMDEKGLIVSYPELLTAFPEKILPHLGHSFSENEIQVMLQRANFYSKSLDKQPHREDSLDKRLNASPALQDAVQRYFGI